MENFHAKAYFRLIEIAHWIEKEVKEVLSPFQITHAQFNVLKILAGSHPKPLSAQDIKGRMILNSPDLTRLLDRLEAKQLVTRTICPSNRRKLDIQITKSGQKMIDNIQPQIKAAVKQFFQEDLSEQEARNLYQLLSKVELS